MSIDNNHTEVVLSRPGEPEAVLAELQSLSTEDLRRELTAALDMTARHLLRLALIVRVLEERGEDLTDLRIGLLTYLRRIAYGQLLPEMVVRYSAYPTLLRHASALPLPDQRRLAAGQSVPLVVWSPEGRPDVRRVSPSHLDPQQIRQVFGPDGLRDEAEQAVLLESRGRPAPPREKAAAPRGRLKADRKRGGLVFGRSFFPAAAVVDALARLHDPTATDAEETDQSVVVRLTGREQAALRVAAARVNLSMTALARRALIALGLLTSPED